VPLLRAVVQRRTRGDSITRPAIAPVLIMAVPGRMQSSLGIGRCVGVPSPCRHRRAIERGRWLKRQNGEIGSNMASRLRWAGGRNGGRARRRDHRCCRAAAPSAYRVRRRWRCAPPGGRACWARQRETRAATSTCPASPHPLHICHPAHNIHHVVALRSSSALRVLRAIDARMLRTRGGISKLLGALRRA